MKKKIRIYGFLLFVVSLMATCPSQIFAQQGDEFRGLTTLDAAFSLQVSENALQMEFAENRLHPAVEALLRASENDVNEMLQQMAGQRMPGVRYRAGSSEMSTELIVYTNPGVVIENALPVRDGLFVVYATLNEIRNLALRDDVRWLEPGKLHVTMGNRARAATGADMLHQGFAGSEPLTGEGVIVAIFDSGIDVKHPSFRVPGDSLSSRIKYVWDQTREPAQGESSPPSPFNFGVLYSRADIEQGLSSGEGISSRDITGHGSHVAGTAAGSAAFTGMAPGADIVAIKGGDNTFSSGNIIAATQFMGWLNETYNRPVVGNFSIGGFFTSRDGTEPTEIMMDEVSQNPGVVMVAAAGNSATQPRYVSAMADADTLYVEVPEYNPNAGSTNDFFLVDVWFDSDVNASMTVISPGGLEFTWNSSSSFFAPDISDGSILGINMVQSANGHRNIVMQVIDQNPNFPPASGTWKIVVENAGRMFDSWLVSSRLGTRSATIRDATSDFSVTTPGSGKSVITVGAYVMQNNLVNVSGNVSEFPSDPFESRAFFSSLGPTRDRRIKPDVMASGRFVASSRSADASYSNSLVAFDSRYVWQGGTSMASPVVAGGVALLLQAFPQAMAEDIKEAIHESAGLDSFTGNLPNMEYGFGKLRLPGALQLLDERYGSGLLSDDPGTGLIPLHFYTAGVVQTNPENRFLLRSGGDEAAKVLLPLFQGIVNGITIHTGEISGDGILRVQLAEMDSDQQGIRRFVGDSAEVPFSSLSPFLENFIPLSEIGIALLEDFSAALVVDVIPAGTAQNSGELEILSRAESSLPRGAVTTRVSSNGINFSGLQIGFGLYTDVSATGVSGELSDMLPPGYQLPFQIRLGNNYPNPFNNQTIIPYEIGSRSEVTITVYDITGRRVATLNEGLREPGRYETVFDGTRLASGVYLYRLRAGTSLLVQKMLLLK
ncbi:MAG: S8 family serine peptidase [Balneolales bacterium]|nr:S8 family serine peptidase [Balneolales bacterium]